MVFGSILQNLRNFGWLLVTVIVLSECSKTRPPSAVQEQPPVPPDQQCAQGPLYDACKSLIAIHELMPASSWNIGHNKTWLRKNNLCEWEGVLCNQTSERVVGLSLIGYSNAINVVTFPPSVFLGLRDLEALEISQFHLKLQSQQFASLTKLKRLVIAENLIDEEIPETTFQNLRSLEILELSKNKYNRPWLLPTDLFQDLISLTQLHLERNGFLQVPQGWFKSLKQLTYLDISGNQITALSRGILQGLENVSILEAAENQIGSLPVDTFFDMALLARLNLSNNSLTVLPERLLESNLFLRSINLSENQFHSLPELLFRNQEFLLSLDLSGNYFQRPLPNGLFANLSNLEDLDLSRTGLQKLSSTWFALPRLRNLQLSENLIVLDSAVVFDQLRNILFINLGENNLPNTARVSATTCTQLKLNQGLIYPQFLCP